MRPLVTITGGSGFVGQGLRPALREAGWRVGVYDPYRGPLVDLVRRRYLAASPDGRARRGAAQVRSAQQRAERELLRARVIRPTGDDILSGREAIASALAGSHAVLHLAGIPHPHQPGAQPADFQRLNYDASIEVYEAARLAGVRTFVFASSAQVYRIDMMRWVASFPIREDHPLPFPSEGQTTYGFLKAAFERYLEGRSTSGELQAIAVRLEYPGFLSDWEHNHYVSTSVENLVAGVGCALRPPDDIGFGAFNLCDAEVHPAVADVQAYLARRWPYVPNHTTGNQSLLSTEKAQRVLGYAPAPGGRYCAAGLVW